jgi:RNA polymerase sigma-70 factor (ECF subfamily)
MAFDDNFADLMARAKAGEVEAVEQFLGQFDREVRLMVRARLPRALRQRYDSVDFVQAVWQSFFQDMGNDGPRFVNPAHLRAYLGGVVRNKVNEENRRAHSLKKGAGQEEGLYVTRGGREVPVEIPSPGPSPSAVVQAKDRLADLLRGLAPYEIEVIMLRRQGLKIDEISARTGIHERSIRRIIEAARARWEARRCS